MTRVTDRYAEPGDRPVVIADFSPPRGAETAALDAAKDLSADFICVAYSPGKAVRVDSAAAALYIREHAGRDVVFNLAARDMNRLALQNHLLGAQVLGLENVVVIQGDRLNDAERERLKSVDDFTATSLIESVRGLNEGLDYRGLKLRAPTNLCVGGAIDLGRNIEAEVALTRRKADAGAHFFITQPIFDPAERERFLALYEREAGAALAVPVFWGLQVLVKDGVIFSSVPQTVRDALERGRDGAEIALELLGRFREAGIHGIYLVAPILRGGTRDYAAAQRVIEAIG